MKTTPSIRTATATDAETLTELAWRTFHDAFAPMNSPENMEAYMSENFTLQKFSAQLADPRVTFLIAEIEAAPVAFAKLYAGSQIFQLGDEAQNDLLMERSFQEPAQ
jgi:hypothetical protein